MLFGNGLTTQVGVCCRGVSGLEQFFFVMGIVRMIRSRWILENGKLMP